MLIPFFTDEGGVNAMAIWLPIVIVLVLACIIGGVVYYRKKNKSKGKQDELSIVPPATLASGGDGSVTYYDEIKEKPGASVSTFTGTSMDNPVYDSAKQQTPAADPVQSNEKLALALASSLEPSGDADPNDVVIQNVYNEPPPAYEVKDPGSTVQEQSSTVADVEEDNDGGTQM